MGRGCAQSCEVNAPHKPGHTQSRYVSLRLARRFRHAYHAIALTGHSDLTVHDLVALHGNSSIASLLLLYAVFCLMPVGGVGNVFGVALWLLSWRWAGGHGSMALPRRVAHMRLNARWSCLALHSLASGYRYAGRWLRPRWSEVQAPWTHPWWAGWIALQAVVIFLPIPLGNVLPAFSLIALGLGRLLADGWMYATSLALGLLGLVYLYGLGSFTWRLTMEAIAFVSTWWS